MAASATLGSVNLGLNCCDIWVEPSRVLARPIIPRPLFRPDDSFAPLREAVQEWAIKHTNTDFEWGEPLPRRHPAGGNVDVETRDHHPPLYRYLIRGGISSWRPADGDPPADDEWWHANVHIRPGWNQSPFNPRKLPADWPGSFGEIDLVDGHYLVRPGWRPPFKADGEVDLHYDLSRTLGPWAELQGRPMLIGDPASCFVPDRTAFWQAISKTSGYVYGCPKCETDAGSRFTGIGRRPAAIRTRCHECGSEFARWAVDGPPTVPIG